MAEPEISVLLRTCQHTNIPAIPANTTLAEALDNSETDVDVASASNISADDFIKVDDEVMKVSSKSTNTLTVVRAQGGTTAATHDNSSAVEIRPTTTSFGYALKCDNVSISYTKTPIQVPIPQQSPQLIDIGIYRPSISLSGVVDTQGGNSNEYTSGFEDMESFNYTRTAGYGSHASARKYYIPYKNKLEDFVTNYVYSEETPLELEWGDASVPTGNNHTGGAVYEVALQQCRFQVDATKEDRYQFSMQFVVTSRKDS